jgi:hypothetical protein
VWGVEDVWGIHVWRSSGGQEAERISDTRRGFFIKSGKETKTKNKTIKLGIEERGGQDTLYISSKYPWIFFRHF